jgi:hypothetical protein
MPRPFAPEHSEPDGVQRYSLSKTLEGKAVMVENSGGRYMHYTDYAQREADHAAEVEGLRKSLATERAYVKKMDGIIEEVGGVTASCINPYEDLKRALLGQKARAEAAERELEKVSAWLRESDMRLGAAVLACNKAERERDMLAESIRNVIKAYDLGEHATTGSELLDETYAEFVAVLRTELGSYS